MVCAICGKEFFEDWRVDRKARKKPCNFCSLSCSHSRKFTEELKLKISNSVKTSEKAKAANERQRLKKLEKGYTKVLKVCPICNKEFFVHRCNKKRIFCSKKCFDHPDAKKYVVYTKPIGGYREHSGNGIYGYYKGNYCASTWELAYIIYLIDNNIPFERNKEKFSYIKKTGKESFYIPDFLVENKIVEIKGPQDLNWKEKYDAFPNKDKLIVLSKKEIYPIIKSLKEKYSVKDIKELYDMPK